MLRVVLAALFVFSFSIPAIADSQWSCSWCRAGNSHHAAPRAVAVFHTNSYVTVPEQASAFDGGLHGPVALSVIFPGLVVLMTMTAWYFLRVMEPQVRQDHPDFIRISAALSALWLVGFYPFLSSALGGFLFCLTATACVGGWFVVRRFGLQARLWELALVIWSFFFFSLVAGVVVTGHGRSLGAAFDGLLEFSRRGGALLGPLLLFAVNGGALFLVFRMAGVKIPRPTEPDAVLRLKIYALVVAVAVFDTYVTESRGFDVQWLSWPLLALPSLAYYGVYWLLARLPEPVRLRTGGAVFAGLALFLTVLACLAAGASAVTVLLVVTGTLHLVALVFGQTVLWRSQTAVGLKVVLSVVSSVFVLAAGFVLLALDTLTPDDRDFFIRERLVLGLLTPATLMIALPGFGFGCYVLLSPRFRRRAKLALAAVMVSFLLFFQGCENRAVYAVWQPDDAVNRDYAGER